MIDTGTPRPEHPRPQFERPDWINLNGPWTYAFDPGKTGSEKDWQRSTGFDAAIVVPFCPESRLSGVGYTDFIEVLWYHRRIEIPGTWLGKQIRLHFGGVDWECEAYVDGQSAGRHFGGMASFHFDLSRLVNAGRTHHLVVRVRDELRSGHQPAGKQSPWLVSAGCHYTRTTGIWQTVWLEAADPHGLEAVHIVPDLDGGRLVLTPVFREQRRGSRLVVSLGAGEAQVAVPAQSGVPVVIPLRDPRPWSPVDPHLYDLELEVHDPAGEIADRVKSYAGLRKVHVEGDRILLNNEPVYLRFVLDQGFYSEGIWTAPTDAHLRRDIELAQAAGFNGARLHQKVFEERFHYWADRLGYLTWGESSSWGFDMRQPSGARNFLAEWREVLLRDRNHPSLIAWTPFNETGNQVDGTGHDGRSVIEAYELTRALDNTRPVNDCSGWIHVRTDLWTVHDYAQDGPRLQVNLNPADGVLRNRPELEPPYAGQPYFVDEFGGVLWVPEGREPHASNTWGYGKTAQTEQEVYERLEGLVRAIRASGHVRGYCYTQLTDVEQEQNGIYSYDRTAKFDMDRIRKVFGDDRRRRE
jgi:beta-galactosidase/beta-glucuronidase